MGGLDRPGRVVGDGVLEPVGKPRRHLIHGFFDARGNLERVRARELIDREPDRRLAVELDVPVVRLSSELDPSHVTNPQDAAPVDFEDHALELLDTRQAPQGVHRILKVEPRRSWRRSDLSRCNLHVLFSNGGDHIVGGESTRLEPLRVEPDAHPVVLGAHHLHVGNTRKPTQLIFDVQVDVNKSTTTRIAGGLMKAPRRGRSAPEYNRRNVAGSTPDLSLPTGRNPPEPFLAASSPIPSVKS